MSRTRTAITWSLATLATGATVGLAVLTAYGDPDVPLERVVQAVLLWLAPAVSALFLLSTLRGRPLWVALALVPIAVVVVWSGWDSHLSFRADVARVGRDHLLDNVGPWGVTTGYTEFYSSLFGLLAGLVAAALAVRWGGWYPLLWWAGTVPWVSLWALLGGCGQQFGGFPRAPFGPPPSGVGWGAGGLLSALALIGWGYATGARPRWPPVGFAVTSLGVGFSLLMAPGVLLPLLALAGAAWAIGLYVGYRRWEWEQARRETREGPSARA